MPDDARSPLPIFMDAIPVPPPPPPGARGLATLARLRADPRLRAAALFFYYLGIILALLLIYGRGDFTTAPFVYQGF